MAVQVGELRHTSAGNVFRLERVEGPWRYIRRVSNGHTSDLWDKDVLYRWHRMHWEDELPLVGEDTSTFPHFGIFCPGL